MRNNFKVVYKGAEAEIIEKKSRFIATAYPLETEEEALILLEQIRKKRWNATHHCFAYVLGENYEIQRYSDDGEPGGTAGKPILDVLLGQGIHNTMLVVTRYFGGTLLGTGGLVRAYSKAAVEGLKASEVIEKCLGIILGIHTDYAGIGKIQYILGQHQIQVIASDYTDAVQLEALVPVEFVDVIKNEITEVTGGQAILHKVQEVHFAMIEKKAVIFE
jgi:uncharacterized YigZ family protein